MNDEPIKAINKEVNFLAGYQIVGGLIGVVLITYMMAPLEEINFYYISIMTFGLLLYVFSFLCGLFVFLRKSFSLKISLINQALQVIGFSLFGYGFEFVAGASFDIFFDYNDGLDITTSLGFCNWHLLLNNDTGVIQVSINIVAIAMIIFILYLRKQYVKMLANIEANDIGSIGQKLY